jgi:hypothetical protein
MRVLWLLACGLASAPALAHAQEPAPSDSPARAEAPRKERRPKHGGLGYAAVGIVAGPIGDIEDGLVQTLGPGTRSPEFGYTVGGGGRMLLFHRVVIGGKGFGLFPPEVGGPNGTARVSGGGGGLELGFAAVNRPKVLFFPYFGVGGFGLGLELRNASQQDIQFGDAAPLQPGEERDYASGFVYLEVGAGLHRLVFFGDGGLAVGFNVGGMFSVAPSQWADAGEPIEGLDEPRLSGAYLQLTVGGGGFFFK